MSASKELIHLILDLCCRIFTFWALYSSTNQNSKFLVRSFSGLLITFFPPTSGLVDSLVDYDPPSCHLYLILHSRVQK